MGIYFTKGSDSDRLFDGAVKNSNLDVFTGGGKK